MTWVKSDDGMSIHRKVAPLSDAAYRLMNEAREWCSRNLTDGRIALEEFPTSSCRATDKNAADLVRRGIWHRAGDVHCGHPTDECAEPGPDGWSIHDYLFYNPSREEVLTDRARKAARQAKYMGKLKAARNGTADTSADASATPSRDAPTDTSRDGPRDASLTPAPSPSPSPPRREAGDGVPRESPPPAALRRDAAGDEHEDQPPAKSLPVPSNGRPDLAAARAAIRNAANRAHRAGPDPGALDRLRELTPDAPPGLVAEPGPDANGAGAPPLDRADPAGSVAPDHDRSAA